MHTTLPLRTRPAVARPRPARAAVARHGWLDRLAAWAERQPRHHRLGRWTAV